MAWAQSAAPDSAAFGSQSGIVSAGVDVSGRSAADECRADGARLDGAGADRETAGVLGHWCAGLEALL